MPPESPELALARRGFRDGAAAAAHLARLDGIDDALVEQVASVASPDTALASLVAIAETWGVERLLATLRGDAELRQRLLIVLGTSEALGDFLARHPQHVEDLAADRLSPVPLDLDLMRQQLGDADDADAIHDEPVFHSGECVGFLTSGGFAHHIGCSVGLGYIPAHLADGSAGLDGFEVEILGQMRPARLQLEPLYDPAGERMRG